VASHDEYDEFSRLLGELAHKDQEEALAAKVEELYTFPKFLVDEGGVYVEHKPNTFVQVANKLTRQNLGLNPGDELESVVVTETVHGERTITIKRRAVVSQ